MTTRSTHRMLRGNRPKAQALGLCMVLLGSIWLVSSTASSGAQAETVTWHDRTPEAFPSPRHSAAMAATGDHIVLFGGRGPDANDVEVVHDDTWVWDGSNWREDTRPGPDARYDAAMAFDGERIVLFGGRTALNDAPDGTSVLGDTWTWTVDDGWNRFPQPATNPNPVPSGRVEAAMAYHERAGQAVLFGGARPVITGDPPALAFKALNETWRFDSTAGWTPDDPGAPKAPPRVDAAMAYDGNDIVLFGGEDQGLHNDTWVLGDRGWAQPETRPPAELTPRRAAAMAYDTRTGTAVLFGGRGVPATAPGTTTTTNAGGGLDQALDDTWTWDRSGAAWRLADPEMVPFPRQGAAMAPGLPNTEPTLSGAVLFGGRGTDEDYNDTLSWQGTVPPPVTTTSTSSTSTTVPPPQPQRPQVTQIDPPSGSTSGGYSIIITGSRFSGTTSVDFGPDARVDCPQADVCSVDGDGSIDVLAPEHAAGTVRIVVTARGLSSTDTAGAEFTYVEPGVEPQPDEFGGEGLAFTAGGDQFAFPDGFGDVSGADIALSELPSGEAAGAASPPAPPAAPVAAAAFLPAAAMPAGAPVAGFPPESGPMPRPAPWFHMVGLTGDAGAAGGALVIAGGLMVLFCFGVARGPSRREPALAAAGSRHD